MNLRRTLLSTALILALSSSAYAATAWPGSTNTKIAETGVNLVEGYEPSGASIHNGQLLIVGDDGDITLMDFDGNNMQDWRPNNYDLEGVASKNDGSDLIYVGREYPETIFEFDLGSGQLTGNSWDLSTVMNGNQFEGLEALAYHNNEFYAGGQGDGLIYVFDENGNHQRTITPSTVRNDLSGLTLDDDGLIYAIHDSYNLMVVLDQDGTIQDEINLPSDSNNQEGLAFSPCDNALFISEDDGDVKRYSDFPLDCPMADLSISNLSWDSRLQKLSYTLSNEGDLDVDPLSGGNNQIYLNGSLVETRPWQWHSSQTDYLSSGGSTNRVWYGYLEESLASLSTGTHEWEVCVDADDTISETDEQNNCSTLSWTFDGQLPDLKAEISSFNSVNLKFNYVLSNMGGISVKKSLGHNTITLDGVPIEESAWIDDSSPRYIYAGHRKYISLTLDPSLVSQGAHEISVCIDSRERILGDADPSNNCSSTTFYRQ